MTTTIILKYKHYEEKTFEMETSGNGHRWVDLLKGVNEYIKYYVYRSMYVYRICSHLAHNLKKNQEQVIYYDDFEIYVKKA